MMKCPPGRRRRPWLVPGLAVLGLVLAGTIAAGVIQSRRLRAELERAQQAMAEGRWASAQKELADLARRWPRKGEVLYPLGRCEEALERPERALAAWERIPADDASFPRAVESRASVLMNLGRFAPAESCLLESLRVTAVADRYPLLRAMTRLFRLEGRSPDASDALIAAWVDSPDPGELLQDLWKHDTEPVPVEGWKVLLDAADPKDDRVWLGRARHAILTGQLEHAATWLERCRERRPDDPAIWHARLDVAMAAGDRARFWEAAGRIPAEGARPEEIAALRAWLAGHGGDRVAERRELTRLVEFQPLQTRAIERLAELAREAGDIEEAGRLRRRKAEVDRAKDQIHKFVALRIDFREHAGELAERSAVLNRTFDRNAWSVIAANQETSLAASAKANPTRPPGPGEDPARSRAVCRAMAEAALARLLRESGDSRHNETGSLADRLADLRGEWGVGSGQWAEKTGVSRSPHPTPHSPLFSDDAESAGLRFVFDNGRSPQRLLPETMSGGVALLDYDGDGWLDVYCVQGGPIRARPGGDTGDPRATDRLFRNRGDGTFEDATERAKIAAIAGGLGYGMGVTVGDYDNDAHPDLFLTRLTRYALLHNRGDGTFEDATERTGLAGPRDNPTSAAFADLDGDGDLDLYVCHYVRWDPDNPTICKSDRGEDQYCDPAKYERAVDHVFRNDAGQFSDVTERAGFTDPEGRGLGVVAADLDDDNRIDLYVANDGTANYLFRNRGGFRFEETALTAGCAGGAEGGYQAGMGLAAADLDGDGRLDLLVTNFYGEGTTLHHNLGEGLFTDRGAATGILPASRYWLGFGIAVFDAANAGRPYVAITNGHVNDLRPFYPYAMPTRLYEGRPDGRLVDISERSGPPWIVPRLGRGLAAGDLDNDGRVDFLVMAQDVPLAYFHNRTDPPGHFVTFRLEGTASNRDGVGARVEVTTAGHRQVAQRVGGGSYISASDGRLHFGLGEATSVDSVEVLWPSGRRDRWTNLAADTGHRLREGDPAARPLAGFRDPVGRRGVSTKRRP